MTNIQKLKQETRILIPTYLFTFNYFSKFTLYSRNCNISHFTIFNFSLISNEKSTWELKLTPRHYWHHWQDEGNQQEAKRSIVPFSMLNF